MDEYIKREAVQEILKRYSVGTWRGIPCYPDEIKSVAKDVNALPTADAVAVVRCKDCMWSRRVDDKEPKYICVHLNRDHCTQWLDSNDFCSYGERRTDDEL